ncbi:hypothetical protein SeLEV6574_g06393 [Synchytrium endobioticum]|nr:hypothetical protein SeLEV6574_g06393 [Synchytrium endobioticum]
MRTFSIFFSLLVLCHQVLSMPTNQKALYDLQVILAEFQACEHAVEEHRALYNIAFALTAPTKEGIADFKNKAIDPSLRPKDEDLSLESFEVRMEIERIALTHCRFLLRMIINVYKYHDLKFPENPLNSFERRKLLEVAKKVRKQVRLHIEHFNVNARYLGLPEMNLYGVYIDDDCWGYRGVPKENVKRVVEQNERLREVLTAEHEKLDRLFKSESEFNGQVELKTKAEIDELFEGIEVPSFEDRQNSIATSRQMVYSRYLVAAEFHHVLADRYKLEMKYLSLDDTDLPEAHRFVLESFRAGTTLDDSKKWKSAHQEFENGYLNVANNLAKEMGAEFVEVSKDLLAKYQAEYMPELEPYISEVGLVTRSDRLSFQELTRAESSNPRKSARAPVRAISKFSSTDQSPVERFVTLYGDARSHDSMNIASSSGISESKAGSSTRLKGSRASRTDGSGIGGIRNAKLDR